MPGSRVRIEQRKPSRERAPGMETIDVATPFQGSPIGPSPNVPGIASGKYVELQWDVTGAGSTMWVAGAGILPKELDDFNAVAAPTGYSFPGAAADDNNWQVPFIMPDGYDSSRSIEVTITVIQEA